MRISLRNVATLGVVTVVGLSAGCLPRPEPDPPAAIVGGVTLAQLASFDDAPYSSFGKWGSHEAFSSPTLGDVTTRGAGAEIVVGGMDGAVRVFSYDGALLGRYHAASGSIQGSPTLANLFGGPELEIIVTTIPPLGSGGAGLGSVIVFDGEGNRLFERTVGGAAANGIFGTPAVGDLDNDGVPEIVVGAWNHNVYAWRLDGSLMPGFPAIVYDTVWSSPTIADLNGDGWKEIVVGGDMDGGNPASWIFGIPQGGVLWVIPHDGDLRTRRTQWGIDPNTYFPGFPKHVPGQVVWSSPSVADIDLDGMLDVVVGTGLNYPGGAGSNVHAWNANGSPKAGFPVRTGGPVMASPALGDLSVDHYGLELAVISDDGVVSVFASDGTRIWAQCNMDDRTSCAPARGHHGSVAIADVNGDGRQEVISPAEHWLRVFNGRNGSILAQDDMDGSTWVPVSTPLIGADASGARIYVAATKNVVNDGAPGIGDHLRIYRWSTGQPMGTSDWPMFRRDAQHSGRR